MFFKRWFDWAVFSPKKKTEEKSHKSSSHWLDVERKRGRRWWVRPEDLKRREITDQRRLYDLEK
jgi:hypothetical protein